MGYDHKEEDTCVSLHLGIYSIRKQEKTLVHSYSDNIHILFSPYFSKCHLLIDNGHNNSRKIFDLSTPFLLSL